MLIHFHGRLILAFVAIVVCARPTYGQSPAITGVVVDERTNRPLSGVLVYAANTPAFSETDDEGRFQLAVPDGKYTLAASLVGYSMVEQEIEVRPGVPVHLTIRLPEGAGTYTEHVTVIGRARDEAGDAPAGMTLHGRELQTVRGVLFDDPLRAVQSLPSAAATDDFYSELSVRGSAFRHIGFAIDGMPARYLMHTVQATTDSGSTVMFNSDALGAVTLLPGSYPQRLGRHLGAQIDLATRDGSRDDIRVRAGLSGTERDGPWRRAARPHTGIVARLGAVQLSRLPRHAARRRSVCVRFYRCADESHLRPHASPSAAVPGGGGPIDLRRAADSLGANDVAQATSQSWLSGLTWRYAPSARFLLSQRIYFTGVDFANDNRTGGALDTGGAADAGWRADASAVANRQWMVEFGADAKRLTGSHRQRRRFDGAADAVVVSDTPTAAGPRLPMAR